MAGSARVFAGHRRTTSADAVTTLDDATVTSASGNFLIDDVGRSISGTNIPAGATIAARNSSTSVEMDVTATANGTGIALTVTSPLTLGGTRPTLYGFNNRCSAANGANTYVNVRAGGATGPIIAQTNAVANTDDTASFMPQGVTVDGPLYLDMRSSWAGHFYIEYG